MKVYYRFLYIDGFLIICLSIVTVTENGKSAFEELRDETKDFDLVLLDLYMPEMDGFELLSLMQEDDRLKTIPVVVMSANDTNEIIANCLSKRF
jgi:CheY-like chemotaxis protein